MNYNEKKNDANYNEKKNDVNYTDKKECCVTDHYKLSRLCPLRLGLAGGIYCGLAVFLWTLYAMNTNHAEEAVTMMRHMWVGYELSVKGAFVGLIYGFIKGFVSLFIIAWLYDMFLCCGCKKSCNIDGSCNTKEKL